MCRGVFWFPKYQMLGISEKLQNTVVVGVGSGMMVVVLALASHSGQVSICRAEDKVQ